MNYVSFDVHFTSQDGLLDLTIDISELNMWLCKPDELLIRFVKKDLSITDVWLENKAKFREACHVVADGFVGARYLCQERNAPVQCRRFQ